MKSVMDRRAFIAGSLGLGLSPGVAAAQQRRTPTVGVLRRRIDAGRGVER